MKNIEKLQKSKSSNVRSLATNGYLRTGHYTGSGRHSKAVSCMDSVKSELELLGIGYATGNDAPRGGVTGEFIVLTSRELIKGKPEAQKFLKKATYTWKKPVELTFDKLQSYVKKHFSFGESEKKRYYVISSTEYEGNLPSMFLMDDNGNYFGAYTGYPVWDNYPKNVEYWITREGSDLGRNFVIDQLELPTEAVWKYDALEKELSETEGFDYYRLAQESRLLFASFSEKILGKLQCYDFVEGVCRYFNIRFID